VLARRGFLKQVEGASTSLRVLARTAEPKDLESSEQAQITGLGTRAWLAHYKRGPTIVIALPAIRRPS